METLRTLLRSLLPRRVFSALQPAYHYALAFFAALRYGFPSRRLAVIGVTGTNGKTTVVHLLHELLLASGMVVGSISSLRFKINDREEPNRLKMTMPGRFRLQRFLADCRRADCRYAVVEVTSEGIKQFRHRFIRFRAAVLTNVRPEHLEVHGGFAAYRAAKTALFRCLPSSGTAVLNREDPSAELCAASTGARTVWYSRSEIVLGGGRRYPVAVEEVSSRRIRFRVGAVAFTLPLGGEFNVSNALAAVSTAFALGMPLPKATEALSRVQTVPGRMEYVQEQPFAVVVDYAHTPDALESIYETLRTPNPRLPTPNSQLICVLGSAGGGRDRWKRPEMGRIASRHCRHIVLTSEDPDDEDPGRITSEIRAGIPNGKTGMTDVVLDRREAIREALRRAKPGDTVIITGMGAQPWFVAYGGERIPWDDREIVREELTKLVRIREKRKEKVEI